jgi:hypothetical protein
MNPPKHEQSDRAATLASHLPFPVVGIGASAGG